jgi:putative addiction module component (TIGR02574 family)
MSVQEIKEEALKLPMADREWLAEELWNSVVGEEDDPALIAELNRRWQEIVTGKVKTIPMEETLERVEKRLAEKRAKRQLTSAG